MPDDLREAQWLDKIEELVSADPMVHVSANFDAPGPRHGHFRRPTGHGRIENFGTENDCFGSKSQNSKSFMILSNNNEGKTFFGRARALPFSTFFPTQPGWGRVRAGPWSVLTRRTLPMRLTTDC